MKITKEQKGITLIALVITIIVLLILAGVAISQLTSNNIFDNAQTAVDRYNEKAAEEDDLISQLDELLSQYAGGESQGGGSGEGTPTPTPTPTPTTVTLEAGQSASVDANGLAIVNTRIVADSTNNIQIVIPAGFAPAILNGSDSTTSNPGQDGSVKSVMPAANWSSITAAQINSGVVIVNAAGEEFVWVPIPNSSNFARTAWIIGGTQQTLAETSTENAYWEDKTTTEYTNMVSSVNTNKGFYISRYEASQGTGNKAQSKRGVSPWCCIAQNDSSQIDAIRASVANSIANTHLMYGIEWDSVLNWLIGHATIGTSTAGQTKTMEGSDITYSKSWGNYNDSTGDAATNSGNLRTTTHNEYWKANNIYDLAGNIFEWTQEEYSTYPFIVFRGGCYSMDSYWNSAAYRGGMNAGQTVETKRFPFQLLLVNWVNWGRF